MGLEKTFEEIIAANFPNVGNGIVTQAQEIQSSIQDKSKGKH